MSSKPVSRPLSPHLQIWKWTLTMALSIFHRASGIALTFGLFMVVWMLFAAASGPAAYACFIGFASSFVGQLMLLGWTGATFFHLFAGIRHLLMDMGYLLTIPQAERAGKVIFIGALLMTVLVWYRVQLGF